MWPHNFSFNEHRRMMDHYRKMMNGEIPSSTPTPETKKVDHSKELDQLNSIINGLMSSESGLRALLSSESARKIADCFQPLD